MDWLDTLKEFLKEFFLENNGTGWKIAAAIAVIVSIGAGVAKIYDSRRSKKRNAHVDAAPTPFAFQPQIGVNPQNTVNPQISVNPQITANPQFANQPQFFNQPQVNLQPQIVIPERQDAAQQPAFIHPDEPGHEYEVGMNYYNQLDYPKAQKNLDSALKKQIGLSGPAHFDVAKIQNSLGNLYSSMANYDSAIECYNHARAIFVKANKQADIASVDRNLGWVCYCQGNYDKALIMYQKAMAIDEKVLETDHPTLAADYGSIAIVYHEQGDYDKALGRVPTI